MGSGTAATKAVSRLVLLDDRFDRLPGVLASGRRVIANIERVSNLFLTKTVYGILLALISAIVLWPFPFLPRQLTLVSALAIGIPSFFLALAPNTRRYTPGILGRMLRHSIPVGLIAGATVIGAYALCCRADTEAPPCAGQPRWMGTPLPPAGLTPASAGLMPGASTSCTAQTAYPRVYGAD